MKTAASRRTFSKALNRNESFESNQYFSYFSRAEKSAPVFHILYHVTFFHLKHLEKLLGNAGMLQKAYFHLVALFQIQIQTLDG